MIKDISIYSQRNNYKSQSLGIWRFTIVLTILLILVIPAIPSAAANATIEEVPQARYAHAMAYDPVNQQVIMFGGVTVPYSVLADTWIFDCKTNTWEQIFPTVHPGPKSNHKMVYDEANQKVILFGGWSDETWAFDPTNRTWTQMHPPTHPASRHSFGFYYDSSSADIVLFGGFLDNQTVVNDLWRYSYTNNTWTQVPQTNPPTNRYGHSMVYDSNNNVAILFGGRIFSLTDQTWSYSNNQWTLQSPSTKPVKRYWFDMIYDAANSQVFLFGGDNEQTSARALSDTWVYSNDIWTLKSPSSSPQARNNHAMAYDSVNEQVILFGGIGEDYSVAFNDTWVYQQDNWVSATNQKDTNSNTAKSSFYGLLPSSLLMLFIISDVIIKKLHRPNF